MRTTPGGLVYATCYLHPRIYERLRDLAAENDRSIAAEIRRAVAILLALNAEGERRVMPAGDGGVWLEFDLPGAEPEERRVPAGVAAAHSEVDRS